MFRVEYDGDVRAFRTKLQNSDRTVVLNLRGTMRSLGDSFKFSTMNNDTTVVRFSTPDFEGCSVEYRFSSPTMRQVRNGSTGAMLGRILPANIVHRILELYYETESVWH